jgi:hypothetical protein
MRTIIEYLVWKKKKQNIYKKISNYKKKNFKFSQIKFENESKLRLFSVNYTHCLRIIKTLFALTFH